MWNLVFLEMLLSEAGHDVVNLGPCTPPQLVADTAASESADAVVISSVNGHGHLDGVRVAEAVRSHAGCSEVPLLIGGKLGIQGSAQNASRSAVLLEAGFDAAFEASSDAGAAHQEFISLVSSVKPLESKQAAGTASRQVARGMNTVGRCG